MQAVQRLLTVTTLLLLLVSCAESGDTDSDADDSAKLTSATASPSTPATTLIPPSMQVTEVGLLPLRGGMLLSSAQDALRGALIRRAADDTAQCTYVEWRGGPPGVRVMAAEGRIARVDIDSGVIATTEGARIGDTEARIIRLYPTAIVSPHKYTDGHYLTVTPTSVSDSAYRLVFETEKGKVTRYRAGKRPEVEFVEGCG